MKEGSLETPITSSQNKENPQKEGSCKFETYLSLWIGRATEILYIQLREFALID